MAVLTRRSRFYVTNDGETRNVAAAKYSANIFLACANMSIKLIRIQRRRNPFNEEETLRCREAAAEEGATTVIILTTVSLDFPFRTYEPREWMNE